MCSGKFVTAEEACKSEKRIFFKKLTTELESCITIAKILDWIFFPCILSPMREKIYLKYWKIIFLQRFENEQQTSLHGVFSICYFRFSNITYIWDWKENFMWMPHSGITSWQICFFLLQSRESKLIIFYSSSCLFLQMLWNVSHLSIRSISVD